MDINNLKITLQEPIIRTRNNEYLKLMVIGEKENHDSIISSIQEAIPILRSNIKEGDKKIIIPSGIYNCAVGYLVKYCGYKWRFSKVEDINKYNIFYSTQAQDKLLSLSEHNKKKLIVFNMHDGKPITGFNNIYEALRWLKDMDKFVDYRSILFVAQNYNKTPLDPKKAKTSKGYIWRFYDDVVSP